MLDLLLWHGKFKILATLGAGGMGTVYRAVNQESGEVVALKTLNRCTPQALYELKAEFRVAATLHHPNLVCLYELYADTEPHFLTMELVEGTDLVTWLGASDHLSASLQRTVTDVGGQGLPAPAREAPVSGPPIDLLRLLDATAQICEGLGAMHAAGLVHRDLKPNNIQLTPQGRAVLLDFGLSRPHVLPAAAVRDSGMAGTLAYLAPEVVAGGQHTTHADMYALGVILFSALTGHYPHPGSGLELLSAKLHHPDVDLADLRAIGSQPLVELVADLLAAEPARRPSARQVLARLHRQTAPDTAARLRGTGVWSSFVGRRAELAWLHEHWERAQQGPCAHVAVICGESGLGKSSLVRRFADGVELDARALVLRVACTASENVAFPALDSAMDRVSDALLNWPLEQRKALSADRAAAVFFPVLRRVPELAHEPASDSREVAMSAWVRLMDRVAEQQPVLLWIDDAQWADADSAAMLAAWLGQARAPRALVVLTQRPQPDSANGFLPSLHRELQVRTAKRTDFALSVRDLPPLSEPEAATLLGHSARRLGPVGLQDLLHQAEGHPYLLCEIAQQLASCSEGGRLSDVSLPGLLRQRVLGLEPVTRRLLLVAAAAEQSLTAEELTHASGLQTAARHLHGLVRARLLRRAETGRVLVYHHALQAAALDAASAAERQSVFAVLAQSAADGKLEADPARIAHFFRSAGDRAQASAFSLQAARQAVGARAYDMASRLFAKARADAPGPWPLACLREEADALALSGQAHPAAAAYAALADHPDNPNASLDRANAAELWIGAGALQEGQAMLRQLALLGEVRVPSTTVGILADALRVRTKLRWRGLTAVDAGTMTQQLRLQLAVCRTASECYGNFDAARALAYQSRYLELAYAANSAADIVSALRMECIYMGSTGHYRDWVGACQRAIATLQDADQPPSDAAFGQLVTAYQHFLAGDFAVAVRQMRDVDQAYGALGTTGWARNFARTHGVIAQVFIGQWAQASGSFADLAVEFQRLGSTAALTSLYLGAGYELALVADDVARARQLIAQALAPWGAQVPATFAYLAAVAEVRVALYQGDWEAAARALHERQHHFRAMKAYDSVRVMHAWLKALVALGPQAQPKTALRAAQSIQAEANSWGRHLPHTIRCAVHMLRGADAESLAFAQSGLKGLADQGLRGYHGGLVWLDAQQRRDDATAAAVLAQWRAAGVVAPARWLQLFAPTLTPQRSHHVVAPHLPR